MAYTRYKMRLELLSLLRNIPRVVTPETLGKLFDVSAKVRRLHRELSSNPFEYVSDATNKEHRDLSEIFAKLVGLVVSMIDQASKSFLDGSTEFVVDQRIDALRASLSAAAEGESATSLFFAKVLGDVDQIAGSE